MEKFSQIFLAIKLRYDRRPLLADLICKAGFFGDCPVLKLQKHSWTNDPMDQLPNQTGIFFSIWLDDKSVGRGRALYNIHALKLRQLKPYRITSIDFAKCFRRCFEQEKRKWPNVSTDFGAQTLMQGWFEIRPKYFNRDVHELMKKFAELGPIFDQLLNDRLPSPAKEKARRR